MKFAELIDDVRGLSVAEFRAKHGEFFLLGMGSSLQPAKRFEATRSAPASRAAAGRELDWLVIPLVKGERSLSLVRLSVGRTANNDIHVEDSSVSRLHAFFEPGSPSWTLKDAGSRLGTKVNGAAIAATTPIRSGDQVTFGDVELTFMNVEALVDCLQRVTAHAR